MNKAKLGTLTRRYLITLLGVILIAWGVSTFLLGFIGEAAPAVITHVRREGGEQYIGRGGRYMYIVSYSFTLPDGRQIDGFTRQVGDGVYVQHPEALTTVRYLPSFPNLNFLEAETRLNLGQVVLIALGLWLIFVGWRAE